MKDNWTDYPLSAFRSAVGTAAGQVLLLFLAYFGGLFTARLFGSGYLGVAGIVASVLLSTSGLVGHIVIVVCILLLRLDISDRAKAVVFSVVFLASLVAAWPS